MLLSLAIKLSCKPSPAAPSQAGTSRGLFAGRGNDRPGGHTAQRSPWRKRLLIHRVRVELQFPLRRVLPKVRWPDTAPAALTSFAENCVRPSAARVRIRPVVPRLISRISGPPTFLAAVLSGEKVPVVALAGQFFSTKSRSGPGG